MEKSADPNLINSNGKLPSALARDKEMKNILAGKFSSPTVTNGVTVTPIVNVTPTAIQSRKRCYSPSVAQVETPTSTAPSTDTPSKPKHPELIESGNGSAPKICLGCVAL
jgi:hypothetical protein